MKIFFIPQNYQYTDFVRQFLSIDYHQYQYAKQFNDNNGFVLILDTEPIVNLPAQFDFLNITEIHVVPNLDTKKPQFPICISIKKTDLTNAPYELIANKILNFHYPLKSSIFYFDSYGIEYLIIY